MVLAGFVLVLASRDRLPVGAAGLLVAGEAPFSVTQGDDYWVAVPALIGAVMLEGVLALTQPALRLFACCRRRLPGFRSQSHMAVLAMFKEMMWPVHLWAGYTRDRSVGRHAGWVGRRAAGKRPRATTGV